MSIRHRHRCTHHPHTPTKLFACQSWCPGAVLRLRHVFATRSFSVPSYSPTLYESVAAASQTAALHSQFPRRLAHQHLKHVVIASAPVVFSTLGLTLSVTTSQGHLTGTVPFTSNHSAIPKLPPTIIRTASTRSVAASHVTHTAVLRCAASNTFAHTCCLCWSIPSPPFSLTKSVS